ncbi:protein tyrosine phosphatase domain-containing protein 1 [Entelurus aequoreus]|uniref:protein tyrosine phosphatase domain-containing protein 1-like n=1 Tax=Entelurus aequoreus TaxID=161455 RepID=UPI002B1E54FB|nr:protein tyrosine phosphatase domain-containing protein 1-like [Entelurus aequoreus]XP_061908730.1 protein tyrosine phosphatase domain-containing protein 1-like [Entelurus aequoreus]XP_061908732.1 protein tyrosine phosphatase domain-containing protein 1-like [Entelurus aequoreus]XP_061908733.1 protein tyrosine phosphatase domain-containing protein 1-like [Entelurus aequoreus]XP_061908734.1 protein tyrosine phosphatase domain-containing protein 1-like [Entelurus aequoreus]XP_061908738.1 prote
MSVHENSSGGALMEFLRAPRAKYTIIGEAIRYVLPAEMQCSIGCGGRHCKYDNPDSWREDQQAIQGLYSSWVTDNLLAMSRPSTEIIEKYNIIEQFRRHGIKTVINLQIPGEHASCGNPLEPESGFSYNPEAFMRNNIYFYNFGWSDYGVANLTTVLDMVKVMAFALQEGKVSVHCHAGLGRTGMLLACFLAYTTRMTANQAILYVRAKRPGSIQTRGQLSCVRDFVRFLCPLRCVFSCAAPRSEPITLTQYLNRQRHILHGLERKELRHLPKIVQLVSRLLLDIAENRQVIEEDILEAPDIHDIEMTMSIIEKLGPEFCTKEPRLPGSLTLPRHFNEPAIFYHRKSLSYSESDLRRLGSQLNLLTQPLGTLSQGNLARSVSPSESFKPADQRNSNTPDISNSSAGSLWQVKNDKRDGSFVVEKIKQKSMQRSESFGNNGPLQKGSRLSRLKAEQREELAENGKSCCKEEEQSEVPFITLQTELSLDARRLLVAQALAVDLFLDGDEEQRNQVLAWQAELNQGGAWERLCMERDPFILTGLMWAWLEQLQQPIICLQDAERLDAENADAQTVLDTLEQAPRETLVCILDCMAHLLSVPEQVDLAFLKRTIKAFTWMDHNEGDVYESMTAVLRCVLEDMRSAASNEEEPPNAFS